MRDRGPAEGTHAAEERKEVRTHGAMRARKDDLSGLPSSDRMVFLLLVLAAGAFALMLVWLVGP